MKSILFLSVIFILLSCKKPLAKDVKFYYISDTEFSHGNDTIKFDFLPQVDTADLFIGKGHFVFNNIDHLIKSYTSDNHAPVDGGRLYYTLDTIGIIYQKSTTWFNALRLQTNCDSINNLISQAFAHILLRTELSCYSFANIETTNKVFIPPVVKEE